MGLSIRKATEGDIAQVTALYQSLVGTAGCTWNTAYPSQEDVRRDVISDALYIICDETDTLLGAAAAGQEEGLSSLRCWSAAIHRPCDLARLGITAELQGQGLAKRLLRHIEVDARLNGFDGIRFLVGKENTKALRLYESLGYRPVGEAFLYETDWYCYEKALAPSPSVF